MFLFQRQVPAVFLNVMAWPWGSFYPTLWSHGCCLSQFVSAFPLLLARRLHFSLYQQGGWWNYVRCSQDSGTYFGQDKSQVSVRDCDLLSREHPCHILQKFWLAESPQKGCSCRGGHMNLGSVYLPPTLWHLLCFTWPITLIFTRIMFGVFFLAFMGSTTLVL